MRERLPVETVKTVEHQVREAIKDALRWYPHARPSRAQYLEENSAIWVDWAEDCSFCCGAYCEYLNGPPEGWLREAAEGEKFLPLDGRKIFINEAGEAELRDGALDYLRKIIAVAAVDGYQRVWTEAHMDCWNSSRLDHPMDPAMAHEQLSARRGRDSWS